MQQETTLSNSQLPSSTNAASRSDLYALKRLVRYLRVLTAYQRTYLAHIGEHHPVFGAAIQHKSVSENLLQRLQSLRMAYGSKPNVRRNFEELCHDVITLLASFFGSKEQALLRAIETTEQLIVSVACGVLRRPSSSAELKSVASEAIDSLSMRSLEQ